MDKRIGKIWLIGAIFSATLFGAREPKISVELLNKNHQYFNKAEIGIPFIVQVTCENFKPKSELQGLENSEDISVQFAGSTQLMNYVNGASLKEEYIFKYIVVIKKKGTFELGPIVTEDSSGNSIRSDTINVVVGDIGQAKHTGNETYLLDLDCASGVIYVGQKLKLDVYFCYRAGFQDLAIENNLFDDVEIGYQDKDWTTSKKVVEGQEYPCKKMSIEVFAKKVGTLIIPSFKASFVAQQRQDIGLLGFFGFANSKIIESHAKQLQVIPLPRSEQYPHVQAIGKFESVTFAIDKKNGEIGEGIHAKMTVQGDGNLDILHHPELVLPNGIHYYEGNSTIERINDSISKKTFDWILQSDQPGSFVIESQNFVYFDPAEKKYTTLSTQPAELIIQGSLDSAQNKSDVVDTEQSIESDAQDVKKPEEIQEPAKQLNIQYYSSQKFYNNSSDLLTKLIMLLAGIVALLFVVTLLMPYFKKIFFIETLSYRWLFWKYARSADIQGIYQLYEKLAADYGFGLQSKELHQLFLENNLSDQSFENWKNFLHMLLEYNFANNKTIQDRTLVVDLAKEWFSIIVLCCKTLRRK